MPPGGNKVPFISVPTNSSVWTSGQAEAIDSLSEAQIAALGFSDPAQVRQTAKDNPGSHWYIWGEPNRYPDPAEPTRESYMTAERFVPVFDYYVDLIKSADPTAKILAPSVLNWDYTCIGCSVKEFQVKCENETRRGYQCGKGWLRQFIDEYKLRHGGSLPPVDAWTIDVYPIDWDNLPNNASKVFIQEEGVSKWPWEIAISQIQRLRDFLDITDFRSTPIWVTEIAVHWGFDDLEFKPGGGVAPTGAYHWDLMSDYLIRMVDWLEANDQSLNIEKWFFFKSYVDLANTFDYAGIYFFDGPGQSGTRNCLGDIYRARSLNLSPVQCDAGGSTVPQ